jgi:hypothetical protein
MLALAAPPARASDPIRREVRVECSPGPGCEQTLRSRAETRCAALGLRAFAAQFRDRVSGSAAPGPTLGARGSRGGERGALGAPRPRSRQPGRARASMAALAAFSRSRSDRRVSLPTCPSVASSSRERGALLAPAGIAYAPRRAASCRA